MLFCVCSRFFLKKEAKAFINQLELREGGPVTPGALFLARGDQSGGGLVGEGRFGFEIAESGYFVSARDLKREGKKGRG